MQSSIRPHPASLYSSLVRIFQARKIFSLSRNGRMRTSTKKKNSADTISDAALATPAVDVIVERQRERDENRKKASDMVVKLKDKLTETQFRRLWMYEAEGKTFIKAS